MIKVWELLLGKSVINKEILRLELKIFHLIYLRKVFCFAHFSLKKENKFLEPNLFSFFTFFKNKFLLTLKNL